MMNSPRLWLVIPAAGVGRRMAADCPKQYLRIRNRYVLDITLSRVLDFAPFAGCVVALNPEDGYWSETDASKDPRVQTCAGGQERADSVLAALQALDARAADDDWVLVHDVARPCLMAEDLARLLERLAADEVGGLLAAPVSDTIKRVPKGRDQVAATEDRSLLWRALTPQMFRYRTLCVALTRGLQSGQPITDEASAIELAGLVPRVVEGRPDNLKITVPADLALAEFILGQSTARDQQ